MYAIRSYYESIVVIVFGNAYTAARTGRVGIFEKVSTAVDIYHLDRGYERIEEKLARLGARVRRVR